MRTGKSPLTYLGAAAICATVAGPAEATFHFMQIEQVMGGVDGDTSAQAIQLRMRSLGQNFMGASLIRAWDAAGQNPILLVDLDATVPNGAPGARVLIVSPSFLDHVDGALAPDFTMTSLIPEAYLAAGSITFEDDAQTTIYWRLSWGGASYTGDTTGSITNDDDGDFGPPYPDALPACGLEALQFQGAVDAKSTTNEDDYALTSGPAVFTNNAGASATVANDCPPDIDGSGSVTTEDLLMLLAAWGTETCGPPDFTGGGVATDDLLVLLAGWGRCPK